MKQLLLLLVLTVICLAFAQKCKNGQQFRLTKLITMKCAKKSWKAIIKGDKRAGPGGPPCEDNPSLPNGTCSADRGHCMQFTVKGTQMDKDCPGTCDSCDGCRCQDNHQWHKYCTYWSEYCDHPGILGNWMSSNCRKSCGKCNCKCCSYQGKQYQLGDTIHIPDKCGSMVCEEGLTAPPSPLLPGATNHTVTHPDELTLSFRSIHDGADCCVLPEKAQTENGTIVNSNSLVQEGWNGKLLLPNGSLSVMCCHGILSVPFPIVHPLRMIY